VRKIVKGNEPKVLNQWKRHNLNGQYIFTHSEHPKELQLLDDDLLKILMEEINQPQDGQLSYFAPILQNILRQFLNNH